MNYIPLEDLLVYKQAMEIGELVWATVDKWPHFPKKTVGGQFCEAADSIAANIAEGYGRFHFSESRHFYFYARGSLLETKAWLQKATSRHLIPPEASNELLEKLQTCHFSLNSFIKSQRK